MVCVLLIYRNMMRSSVVYGIKQIQDGFKNMHKKRKKIIDYSHPHCDTQLSLLIIRENHAIVATEMFEINTT